MSTDFRPHLVVARVLPAGVTWEVTEKWLARRRKICCQRGVVLQTSLADPQYSSPFATMNSSVAGGHLQLFFSCKLCVYQGCCQASNKSFCVYYLGMFWTSEHGISEDLMCHTGIKPSSNFISRCCYALRLYLPSGWGWPSLPNQLWPTPLFFENLANKSRNQASAPGVERAARRDSTLGARPRRTQARPPAGRQRSRRISASSRLPRAEWRSYDTRRCSTGAGG